MVSLKKKFSIYFFISALVLVCLLVPVELKARIACCKNGELSTCPDLPNGQQYDISGCMSTSPIVPDGPIIDFDPDKIYCRAGQKKCCVDGKMQCVDEGMQFCLISCGGLLPDEDCGNSGTVQYKPSGSCGTSERTCCSNGKWSGWGEKCSETSTDCSSSTKPKTSQTCDFNNGRNNGIQTRSVTCNNGVWKAGAWSACKCNITCNSAQVPDPTNCRCCDYTCYLFKNSSGLGVYCNCADYVNTFSECCTMTNGDEYRLPAYYSSCSTFAEAMGLRLDPFAQKHACSHTTI